MTTRLNCLIVCGECTSTSTCEYRFIRLGFTLASNIWSPWEYIKPKTLWVTEKCWETCPKLFPLSLCFYSILYFFLFTLSMTSPCSFHNFWSILYTVYNVSLPFTQFQVFSCFHFTLLFAAINAFHYIVTFHNIVLLFFTLNGFTLFFWLFTTNPTFHLCILLSITVFTFHLFCFFAHFQ